MKQLDEKAVWLFFAGTFFKTITFFLIMSFWIIAPLAMDDFFNPTYFIFILITVAVLTSIVSYVWARLTYHFFKYELTDLGFKKESGIIYKKYVTIPYERIQNVDIDRGIVARILGLSDLKIQTAGSSGTFSQYGATGLHAEGRIPGLSKADAEQLQNDVISRATKSRTQGL